MDKLIEQHRHRIVQIAKTHGLSHVRVFGSMARGDANESSDVDLLVRAGPRTSGLDLAGLLGDVESLLGRKVDVVVDRSVHSMLKDRIVNEAMML